MNQEQFNNINQNQLTPRQKQVLTLFLAGQSYQEIAREIGANHRTATAHHIRNISKNLVSPGT